MILPIACCCSALSSVSAIVTCGLRDIDRARCAVATGRAGSSRPGRAQLRGRWSIQYHDHQPLLHLPSGLQAGEFNLGIALGRGIHAETASFSWIPNEPVPATWLPQRGDLTGLAVDVSEDGVSRLLLNPSSGPSDEDQYASTLLQLSNDALVNADDLKLLPEVDDSDVFEGFQSRELATDEDDQLLSSARWLLVSSRADGTTRHTAFYRPQLAW